MFFLFGLAAMAVDLIYAYVVKAKLVTAVDAAALAAARALTRGTTPAEQQTEVNNTVNKLINTNFPSGFMMTTSRTWATPTITDNGNGTRSIAVSANATVPTFFMRAAGYTTLPVAASATALRRDVNMVIVLDRSGSLVLVSPPAWDEVQAAAKIFIDNFDTTRDKIGVVSFGSNARVDYTPQTNFKAAINSLIDSMQAYSTNRTDSPYGLWKAYEALAVLPNNGALNVITFFTDGQPTAFVNHFPVKTSGSPRCTSTPREGVYFTAQDGSGTWGLFNKDATANPTPNPDFTIIGSCPGLASNGSNGENLILSYPAEWRPNGPATTPIFSIAGPASPTSDIYNGDHVINIAYNLTIRVADYARQSSKAIRIYAIGLGGYLYPADDVLLQNVSNDPASASYSSSEPTGFYVYAPDQTQLVQAFQRVASEITRLIQ